MLTVRFISVADVKNVYDLLGVEGEPFGSNFVMFDGDTPVALWRMKVVAEREPVGIIRDIVFVDGVEDGDKTFFLHAMFFKLTEGAPIKLRIEGIKPEFKKFGFEEVDGDMETFSENINLHYMCGGYKG